MRSRSYKLCKKCVILFVSGSTTWRRSPCTCPGAVCSPTANWWPRATRTSAGTPWRARGTSTSSDSASGSEVRHALLTRRLCPLCPLSSTSSASASGSEVRHAVLTRRLCPMCPLLLLYVLCPLPALSLMNEESWGSLSSSVFSKSAWR